MKFTFIILFLFQLNLIAAPIKVGSSPVISSAGLYLAQTKGYFKEEGLEVDITDFNNSGAPMTILLSKNELDVGAGNLSSSFFNAFNAGQEFKIVADKGHLEAGKDYIGLIVRTDHLESGRYKELKDLKGFKMGLTALDGVSQQIVAEKFLSMAGLKPTDVEFVKLSYADMNVALKAKNIDATIQLEPFLTKAVLDKIAVNVAPGSQAHPKQQSAAIFFSPRFFKEEKVKAVKFLKAYLRGIRDYNNSLSDSKLKESVILELKKSIKIADEAVWNQMIPIGLFENGKIDKVALNEDLKWYFDKKYITKIPNIDELVDESLITLAYNELNPIKKTKTSKKKNRKK